MAVVAVIDHGIQNRLHPDVISVIDSELGRITISTHDRSRRDPLDEHLAHLRRRAATGPGQAAQLGQGAGSARRRHPQQQTRKTHR